MYERRYRTYAELTYEEKERLDRVLERGYRKHVMRFLVLDLIEMLEEDQVGVLSDILTRRLRTKDILKLGGKNGPRESPKKDG